MNLYDFLIIYLACGAPFGVYYFLQHRNNRDSQKLLLITFIVVTFWIPFAFRLFAKTRFVQNSFNNLFGSNSISDANIEKQIRSKQTGLESALIQSGLNLSIYQVREILDRYVGLSLAGQSEAKAVQIAPSENEIFLVAEHKNIRLASICLRRRNREHLSIHQTLARPDFLNLLSGKEKLVATAIEFVSLLSDVEAKKAIEKMFDLEPQTENALYVKNAEKQIWKSELQKPAFTKMLSTRLKALTATMNLREKD